MLFQQSRVQLDLRCTGSSSGHSLVLCVCVDSDDRHEAGHVVVANHS